MARRDDCLLLSPRWPITPLSPLSPAPEEVRAIAIAAVVRRTQHKTEKHRTAAGDEKGRSHRPDEAVRAEAVAAAASCTNGGRA